MFRTKFKINGFDEKYLTFILIHIPKKKLWKNLEYLMVQAWRTLTDFEIRFISMSHFQDSESKLINHLHEYCPIDGHKLVTSYK